MSVFFRGMLLLVIATFIGECVEFVVNMVLARELGEGGMGLYMSVLPTIFFVFLIASFELPVSISKFIAEQDEQYHRNMLHHVIRLTTIFASVLFVLAIIILPFIPVFERYHPFLRWLVIVFIPIVSFSAIARGFFMGNHQMGKIAFVHFLRKIIQLGLLVFVYQWFEFDEQASLLVAICTLIGSEMIIFLYLIHQFFIQYRELRKQPMRSLHPRIVRKSLMSVSIPTTAMRIFHSFTHAVEPFLIKYALVRAGLTAAVANEHFGLVAGVAMTIGFFPAFIAHSLLIVLIPTVSEAFAQNDVKRLRDLLQKVMLITCLYGIPAVCLFYFFAEPLTNLFFDSSDAVVYLQMLSPYFLFHFFTIPMQAYLIGLGLVKDAFIHNVWSSIIAFSLIFFLGSMKQMQMDGVIIGMNAGATLLMLMHYFTICKKLGVSIFMKRQLKQWY